MKIKLLVTGGNGQLALCIKDLSSDYPNIDFVFTDVEELDITNSNQLNLFFESHSFDWCVNCAAYTAVDQAESHSNLAYEINAIGAKNLAFACKTNNLKLIHLSTDFIFDGHSNKPYTEQDKPNPLSVYGNSKLHGEQEIQEILKEHFIIRTSWLYSEYGHNFLKTMMRLAKEKNEINVVTDQMGTPTYAKDLAKVILMVFNDKSKNYGTYHYSNFGVCSWYDFAVAIFNFKGFNVKVNQIKTKDYPAQAKRPSYSVLDTTKIKQNLNIEIKDWKDSLSIAISNLK